MAKIRRDDKQIFWVCQIRTEDLSVFLLLVGLDSAHQNGDNGEASLLALHHLGNIRQMHLDAVLIFIHCLTHGVKLTSLLQLTVN